MAKFSQRPNDGVASALGIHLSLYCAVAGCLVLGLYALMQPSRSPNPGLAAYKPPPGTVVNYVAPAQTRERTEAAAAVVILPPEPETTGLATRAPEPPAVETLPLPAESTRPAPAQPGRERGTVPAPSTARARSGRPSHAFTKGPILPPPGKRPVFDESGTYAEESLTPAEPDFELWDVGHAALAAAAAHLGIGIDEFLYARVDVLGRLGDVQELRRNQHA